MLPRKALRGTSEPQAEELRRKSRKISGLPVVPLALPAFPLRTLVEAKHRTGNGGSRLLFICVILSHLVSFVPSLAQCVNGASEAFFPSFGIILSVKNEIRQSWHHCCYMPLRIGETKNKTKNRLTERTLIMGKILGIDLGTTNSCMAVMDQGKFKIIPNAEGANTTDRRTARRTDGKTSGCDEPEKHDFLREAFHGTEIFRSESGRRTRSL